MVPTTLSTDVQIEATGLVVCNFTCVVASQAAVYATYASDLKLWRIAIILMEEN